MDVKHIPLVKRLLTNLASVICQEMFVNGAGIPVPIIGGENTITMIFGILSAHLVRTRLCVAAVGAPSLTNVDLRFA